MGCSFAEDAGSALKAVGLRRPKEPSCLSLTILNCRGMVSSYVSNIFDRYEALIEGTVLGKITKHQLNAWKRNFASSAESVGAFWLWKLTKVV